VGAALALVEADALRPGAPGAADGAPRALEFAAARLADGRATAPPAGLLAVLRHVALGPWPEGAEAPPAEREARFVALLRGGGLRGGGAQRGPGGGGLEVERALALARAAGFARGEAQARAWMPLLLPSGYAGCCSLWLQPCGYFACLLPC